MGTGFSDSFLNEITDYINNNKDNSSASTIVLNGLKPDILIEPKIVWEIGFDSFTISPIYQVGRNTLDKDKGISLRFPKFIRERKDKNVNQANNPEDIIDMYTKSINYK